MEFIRHRGLEIPLIGLGTWCVGDNPSMRSQEVATLLYAKEHYGMTLVDTAEMYGLGKSESVVADFISQCKRQDLFVVDKILPENAEKGLYEERLRNSLKILGCEYIDLYLLHWKAKVPLQPMVDAMESLVSKGLIKHWGVSNFDVDDMEELFACRNGSHCFANQILYNVSARGVEYDLFDWCKEHDVLLMAYSPLGDSEEYRGKIRKSKRLVEVAQKYQTSIYGIMLRFSIQKRNLVSIFKTSSILHLDENLRDVWKPLDKEDMNLLEQDFPTPTSKIPLEKI